MTLLDGKPLKPEETAKVFPPSLDTAVCSGCGERKSEKHFPHYDQQPEAGYKRQSLPSQQDAHWHPIDRYQGPICSACWVELEECQRCALYFFSEHMEGCRCLCCHYSWEAENPACRLTVSR